MMSVKSRRTAAEARRDRDLAYMRDPNEWFSTTLCCPVKRYVKNERGYTGLEVAYLIGDGPNLYHGSIFARTADDRKETFPSFEAIVDAGWVVD